MATFIVNQIGDDTAAEAAGTTLREAIALAAGTAGADTIVFDGAVFAPEDTFTIHLVQGALLIDSDLTIDGDLDGDDTPDVVISGDANADDITRQDGLGNTITDAEVNTNDADNSRVFLITNEAEAELNGLIVTGGRISGAVDGGGIRIDERAGLVFSNGSVSGNKVATNTREGGGVSNDGTLMLVNSDVSFNVADAGGGIRNRGAFTAENSTITHNIAEDLGGGLFTSGGPIFFGGDGAEGFSVLRNVTIANNTVTASNGTGGGIQAYDRNLFDVTRTGTVEMTHVTITGNSATQAGGGISVQDATVFAYNSIILGNGAQSNANVDVVPGTIETFFDGGGNILSGDPATVFAATAVRAGGDGVTGTADDATGGVLGDNGGPLLSVDLRNDNANPALDVGGGTELQTDATGAPRAIDRAGVENSGDTDAGALELQQGVAATPEVISGYVVNTAAGPDQFDGLLSLEEAVAQAEANPDANVITFDPTVFTGGAANTIRLSERLHISTEVTIDGDLNGDGIADIVLSGDRAGDDLTMTTRTGLTITDVFNSPELSRSILTESRLKDNVQILNVLEGANVSLNGLVLTGGADLEVFNGVEFGNGGAVYNSGTLSITNSTLAGNVANDQGGALFNAGIVEVRDSTVSDNLAPSGAGILNFNGSLLTDRVTFADNVAQTISSTGSPRGAGLYNQAVATLINTTMVGNRAEGATGEGAGIFHTERLSSDDVSLDLLNVTLTGNGAKGTGGAIFFNTSDVTIANSLILGNDAASSLDIGTRSVSNGFEDRGGNIVGGDVTQVFDQTAVTSGADGIAGNADDGLAGVLANNGGVVQTVALDNSDGNPALDNGSVYSGLGGNTDADGSPRAVDRDGVDNGGVLDSGAVEVQEGTVVQIGATAALIVNTTDDGNLFDGLTSISEALALANSDPDQSTITFDPTVFTGGAANIIRLSAGLEIFTDVTIDGDLDDDGIPDIVLSGDVLGDDATTIDANGTTITDVTANTETADNVQVIRMTDDAVVILNGLTITGGVSASNGGGILAFPRTSLTLTDSSVSGNRSVRDGGGLFTGIEGDVTISNALISDNYAGDFGGGLISSGATTITGSVLSGNGARVGGGGIYVNDGTTTASGTSILDNTASRGGGVQSLGEFHADSVTIQGNSASLGGGVNVGFAASTFSLGGYARLANTTVAQNVASSQGGGVFASVGTVEVESSTLTGNAAGVSGGGAGVNRGRVEFVNSVVLGNSAATGAEVQDDPDIVDYLGNVLSGDAALIFAQTVTNPGFDGLAGTADDVVAGLVAGNGGPVQTALLRDADDNPAIDISGYSTLSGDTDANGNPRFVDRATGGGSGVIDAGAVEVQSGSVEIAETPTLVVNTQGDSDRFDGLTSLREAIELANTNPDFSAITFDPSVFTGGAANVIRLTFGELELTSDISIFGDLDGDGRPDIVVSGDAAADDAVVMGPNGALVTDLGASVNLADNASRIFTAASGANAVLDGLVLTGGAATLGGGIAFEFGSAGVFQNGAIVGNRASGGGGVSNASSATRLENVEIAGNVASQSGGGVYNGTNDVLALVNVTVADNVATSTGAGLFNDGRLTLTNATIAGNQTNSISGAGGGIWNESVVDAFNTTITGNTAQGSGGAIINFGLNTEFIAQNSIVLGNASGAGRDEFPPDFTDNGGNVIGVAADQVFSLTGTLAGADGITGTADDVIGGVAGDNGGFLTTVALLDDDANPALDRGNSFPSGLTQVDATGAARGVDRAGVDNGGIFDAGAVELQTGTATPLDPPAGLVVTTLSDKLDAFDGATSLREALVLANSSPDFSEITFDPTVFVPAQDNVIRLTEGTLVLTTDMSINGDVDSDGLPDVTISGDRLGDDATTLNNVGARITDVFANTNTADNVQVARIENTASVSLNGLTLTGGFTTQNGGGLNAGYGSSLNLTNSSIAGNYAQRAAGGLNNNGVASAFNVAFTQNSTGGDGGGLATRGANGSDANGTLFGANLTISGNYAAQGAGGIVSGEAGIIVASTIVGNTSGTTGGGAEADFFDPFTLINTTISTNQAGGRGNGLFGQSNSTVFLQNSIILGNGITQQGQIERGASSGAGTYTDLGGNLIVGDSAAVFAITATRVGLDGVPGTADDITGAALDNTGALFQSVSLRDAADNPALAITPTSVVLNEADFGVDLNGDGDATDTGITVDFAQIGASTSLLIDAIGGDGGPTDPGDGGPTDPGDGGPTDPGDGGPTDPGDGGPTDPGDGGPTDPGDGGPTDPGDGGPTEPGDGGPTDPGDGGPDTPDQDQYFTYGALGVRAGGSGTDTVDFSGLARDELPGALDGVIVDLDLNSEGSGGSGSQQGGILDDFLERGGAPIPNGGLIDIENVIGSPFDDGISGNNEANLLLGGAGDDIIAGFGGSDTLSGGPGADTFRGSAADLHADRITGFEPADKILVEGESFDFGDVAFDRTTGTVEIDLDDDGLSDLTLNLGSGFEGFALAAVPQGTDTVIVLAPLFDETFDLAEGQELDAGAINGIFNQIVLDGDGAKIFELDLLDISTAAFRNSLGVYEVNSDGDIVDTRILLEDVSDAADGSLLIDGVEAGHTLGFFILQDGADFAAGVDSGAVLSFVNAAGDPANIGDGEAMLAVDGLRVDESVFHSYAASLNSDGAEHAISGLDDTGAIVIGFEDLTDLGDADFQDVVFRLSTSDGFDM